MMFIEPQPEPINFNKEVREKGIKFLAKHPRPKSWKNYEYWRKSIPNMYIVYKGICAYSMEWIPDSLTDPTIDHFQAKSKRPELAYEWSNFRLACNRFNRLKLNYEDVLDPFQIGCEWFWMHFPSLQLLPNKNLNDRDKDKILSTIRRLNLNGTQSIRSRSRWIYNLRDNHISFDFVKENAPFIAHELERQEMLNKLTVVMAK